MGRAAVPVLANSQAGLKAERDQLDHQRTKLKDQQKKLLQLHYQEALSAELFADESRRIEEELRLLGRRDEALDEPIEGTIQQLIDLETLLTDVYELYLQSDDQGRREINQGLFEQLRIGHDGVTDTKPTDILSGLVSTPTSTDGEPAQTQPPSLTEILRESWKTRPTARAPNATEPRTSRLSGF